ncbi:MAG: hypothetical protein LBC41_09795, partial [Clostridiales bacterium]|nr:hypothetical protein [Clostridiales bacterium]
MNCFKRPLLAILFVVTAMSTASCGKSEKEASSSPTQRPVAINADSGETWAVYWYICGSDLESGNGFATTDIEEAMSVPLPSDVTLVMQTGGADYWEDSDVKASKSQIFVYDEDGRRLDKEQSRRNMGDGKTLSSFLEYCLSNYPADHMAAILWNHGGGSLSGVAFDEQYDYDSLSMAEIREAFSSVSDPDPENPLFEMIGFDACLMATVDTAATLYGFSKTMVASQETEPALGWDYAGLMGALASDPSLDGIGLGKIICDTYAQACDEADKGEEITLSVIDLTNFGKLQAAYDNIGINALASACQDPKFLSKFGRAASKAEKYDSSDGNLIDLGSLVKNSESMLLPENSQSLLSALETAVAYSVNGPYRSHSSGLSCFYPVEMDWESVSMFNSISESEAYKHLFEYALTGQLSEEGAEYASAMEYVDAGDFTPEEDAWVEIDEPISVTNFDSYALENYPVYIDDNGYATLDLGSEISDMLTGVYFELAYVSQESDMILMLGRDNDIDANWDYGIFQDNFRNAWPAIDGSFVYMELENEGDDYNLYTIPVTLNGEPCHLSAAYDFNDSEYRILGARRDSETDMSDKNLRKLKPGDELVTMLYAMSISGDD